MSREFDIVVFGATGLTGKYAVEQTYKASKEEGLTFAVAGRNENKLVEALKEVAVWLQIDSQTFSRETPKVIADVSDAESLHQMAKRARIIINTVGPYKLYGEAVVSACVDEGTNHVDVSGEPFFIESMQLKYHKAAQEKKIYIVSACGFDSIPSELTFNFVKENFKGRLNSVETFLTFSNPKGAPTNTGTWNSGVHGVESMRDLPALKQQISEEMFRSKPKKPNFKLQNRRFASTPPASSGYIIPFLGSDKDIIERSEMYRCETSTAEYKPVQVETYLCLARFGHVIGLMFIGGMFISFAKFACGRRLLIRHPRFFSFGLFSNQPPTREDLEAKSMKIIALGRGCHSGDDENSPPTREIVVEMNGPDPAYISTSIVLVQSAMCILNESMSMPLSGGCIPPGFAFEKTTLRRRLNERGITFKVVQQP